METSDQRKIRIGRKYNEEKSKCGGDRKSNEYNLIDTAQKFANEYKIGEKSVRRYGQLATEIEEIKTQQPELANEIINGTKTFNDHYNTQKYVYIITHPKFEGWIKLGIATNTKRRLGAYQTACPDKAFKIEYEIKTVNAQKIEEYFRDNIEGSGEWYKCKVSDAINIISLLIKT